MSTVPPDPALIARALDVLEAGGLVAFPTETVYGLGADADNAAAVDAIFRAKGRPADHPVIVHVAGAGALPAWTRALPPAALRLATAFWPGPLTLVVPAGARALPGITGGQDTVGLRAPAHPWARALLAGWTARRGDPAAALAGPSANPFGYLSPTSAAHVRDGLGERPGGVVDLILDGGACEVGIESTIVDLSAATPRILRPGAIGAGEISALLGITVEGPGEGGEASAAAPRAPGTLEQHYAPHKPLELVASTGLAARLHALRSVRVGLLAPAAALVDVPPHVERRLIAAAQPADYARELYRSLHELDGSGVERIVVVMPPDGPAWAAVWDRLRRAAAATAAARAKD